MFELVIAALKKEDKINPKFQTSPWSSLSFQYPHDNNVEKAVRHQHIISYQPAMHISALPLSTPPQALSRSFYYRHLYTSSTTTPPPSPSPSHISLPDPLHHSFEEPQASLKTPTIRSRLSQLCREGQPHIARQLFDTLPKPKTVLWNTIIIGFICNQMSLEALLFYSRMRSVESMLKCGDSYTYSSVMKACADTRDLKTGKAVHCHVIRSGIKVSRIVYNSLLNMYSCCLVWGSDCLGEVDLVQKVFDTMKKRNVIAWNIMIAWYVKTERFKQALLQFRHMMKMSIKPTVVSFVNVFPAASVVQDYKIANVLYGMLVKFGDDFVNDLFVVSSAISMYSQMGYIDIARKIFDKCVEKNVEVWNTMICGYIRNCCYIEALDLFVEALESMDTFIDDLTFVVALTAASQLQQLCIGTQLHAHVIKGSIASSVTVLNAIIVMYSRCNFVHEAFKVFDAMMEKDIVSWNTMITAFVQNGFDEEGLMLVKEMQKQGFFVDSVTATALLSASSDQRNKAIGKQTHAYLIRHGIQFEGMESYLIGMYAKCGWIKIAQYLFERNDDYSRDVATWNAMLSSSTQNGLIEEVFIVFQQMLERNVVPNAVTVASILPACSQIGGISFGKQLHGFSIRHLLHLNVFVGAALVDMYSKSGAITFAENVFSTCLAKNHVTYTSMILGYAQHGMGAAAISLFQSMQDSGINPDAITLVAVLSACSHTCLVDEGLQIFHSLETVYGIKTSIEHYCCVVDMLGRVGRLEEAFQFAEEVGEKDNAVRAWGSLFSACTLHKQYELAKLVANKLLEMAPGNIVSGYHVLLSNIYADEGNWKNVDRVRKEMQERGLRKEVGCSWIELAGSTNRFVSKDWKHHKCEDIYEMVETLAMEMRDAGYIRDNDALLG